MLATFQPNLDRKSMKTNTTRYCVNLVYSLLLLYKYINLSIQNSLTTTLTIFMRNENVIFTWICNNDKSKSSPDLDLEILLRGKPKFLNWNSVYHKKIPMYGPKLVKVQIGMQPDPESG